jgi:hypothetical protein
MGQAAMTMATCVQGLWNLEYVVKGSCTKRRQVVYDSVRADITRGGAWLQLIRLTGSD